MNHKLLNSLIESVSTDPVMKIGHSYLRWSSAEQGKGDSFLRQIEQRDSVCRKRGITLVATYTDEGVSAHKGRNRIKGELKGFLKAIGKTVKPGEYLLIENIDRLSREKPRQAWKQFEQIIDAGVIIITCHNDREYSAKAVDENPWIMHELLGEMQRAYSESKLKSERIGGAFRRKRLRAAATKEIMTPNCPAWLEPVFGETLTVSGRKQVVGWKPIQDRIAVLQRIFELAASGMGQWSIAKTLNRENVPTFRIEGRRYNEDRPAIWRAGVVGKIISNRAVLGHFTPNVKQEDGRYEPDETIEGYFGEPFVEPALWVKANSLREGLDMVGETLRKRRGKVQANLFAGLCQCEGCGSILRYTTQVRKSLKNGERKKTVYLFCENREVADACTNDRQINLNWFEETFFKYVREFPFEDILSHRQTDSTLQDISNKIAALQIKLDRLDKDAAKARRFAFNAEEEDDEQDWLKARRDALAAMKPLEKEIAVLRRKHAEVELSLKNTGDIRVQIGEIMSKLESADPAERFIHRQKLAALIKTFVTTVNFDVDQGYVDVILGEGLVNYRFSLTKRGGAPKQNPMKLIHKLSFVPAVAEGQMELEIAITKSGAILDGRRADFGTIISPTDEQVASAEKFLKRVVG